MTWVNLGNLLLGLIKFTNALFEYLRERDLIKRGVDEQIGREALALLASTAWGREVSRRVHALTGKEMADLVASLPTYSPSKET